MTERLEYKVLRRGAELVAVAMFLATPLLAHGQAMQESGGDFVDDGSSGESIYSNGAALPSGAELPGPRTVREAYSTGQGLRIGRGAAPRTIPPVYTVERGDTLWDITGYFYGDPFAWPRVWSYNPEITNPNWIYPLDQVRLMRDGATQVAVRPDHIVRATRAAIGPQQVFLRQEGYLDTTALESAGEITGSTADHMLLMPYEQVYLHFPNRAEPVSVGQELSIFHAVDENDRGNDETGTLVRIYGSVRIDDYNAEERLARATIVEALDPIERGYHVADVPRRFDTVGPIRNERDVRTVIAATIRPRTLIGEHQVLFLGAGSEEGVQVGNRLFVMHRGDTWQETVEENSLDPGNSVPNHAPRGNFPDEVIAEVRIVHVRPHTSTAFVTMSLREVAVGDRAEMRAGY